MLFAAFFTIGSWKATKTRNMSPKLRGIQQRFLLQLCLQAFVPFVVVVGPTVVLVIVMLSDLFDFVCKFIEREK